MAVHFAAEIVPGKPTPTARSVGLRRVHRPGLRERARPDDPDRRRGRPVPLHRHLARGAADHDARARQRVAVAQRQRFTIAHEIGHYYERVENGQLDFTFIDRRGQDDDDVHEFYADEFAGNLLMPGDHVRHFSEEGWNLARMASHFQVSLPAMRLRL